MFKSFFKKVLSPSGNLYRFLSYWCNFSEKGYLPQKIENIDLIFEHLSQTQDNVSFLQIGSNDGISGDPLNKFINNYNWSGILVEPIPFLFEKLERNYIHKKKNLIFFNIAISAEAEGYKDFFSIDEKFRGKLPDWYFQLGTFYKDVLYHHEIPEIDTYIKVIKVPVNTVENILAAHQIKSLDVIHIDTEGYDYEILKTIDLKQYLPKIILIEYFNLNKEDQIKILGILKANNYKTFRNKQDFMSIHSSVSNNFLKDNILYPKWD